MTNNFRTAACGDTSYFRPTKSDAEAVAQEVMARNGCGHIEERQSNGLWNVIARFEPFYGIVPA